MAEAAKCRLVKGREKRVRRALCCEGGGVERAQQTPHATLCRALALISFILSINTTGRIADQAPNPYVNFNYMKLYDTIYMSKCQLSRFMRGKEREGRGKGTSHGPHVSPEKQEYRGVAVPQRLHIAMTHLPAARQSPRDPFHEAPGLPPKAPLINNSHAQRRILREKSNSKFSLPKRNIFRFSNTKTEYTPLWH